MILNLLDVGQLEEGKLAPAPRDRRRGLARAEGVPGDGGRRLPARRAAGDRRRRSGPRSLRGDGAVLRRVMDNLLVERDRALAAGGRSSPCRSRAATRGSRSRSPTRGRGVPAEFRERIFEKFQRLESRKSAARSQPRPRPDVLPPRGRGARRHDLGRRRARRRRAVPCAAPGRGTEVTRGRHTKRDALTRGSADAAQGASVE